MEQDFLTFQKDLMKWRQQWQEGNRWWDYDEAMEKVRALLSEKLSSFLEEERRLEKKDKEYLRQKKKFFREQIMDIVLTEAIRVRGYEGAEGTDRFVDDMVAEFVGYSVLEEAFQDPDVTDIYVIKWDTIFVERRGKNERYHRAFRSPKHFKDVLERFVREAGKEINMGDSCIVDFELYGDRGCATSPRVSPEGYSLTIRKHAEDHITRDQLVAAGVLSEEMADFLGMLILGEMNIIYAGLTGSGKTTTIRALLDDYVSKANKRMLVCEDTQELFPKNEHTLQLISVRSDDARLAVPLSQLVYTALRLKPKYIVVGEVRGEEAQAAVEAMETGHSTIFTMHGGSPWNIVNRLVTKYLMAMPSLGIDVVERIIGSGVDYVCIQDNIPGVGRKCTSIHEVCYNFETRRVELKPIWKFNLQTNSFERVGRISFEKAETMMRRGVRWEQIKSWAE
ncbi:CpaF family protein [Geobacillus subterraneus]|uniref:Bacterial type II secretion system protein E domain-containing protein n=1 Tax=Geobacillus subterraneus TaxID=129338 RepID=A0A679FQS9_9BACL|nr:ATPase, T2SS/T4P/T4SS family [Geobacillus subterraneus]BBW98918.1 hypothetical protein GsuE55_37510 [Geobacillus subterraneus]